MFVLSFFNVNSHILLDCGSSKGALIFFISFQNGIGAFEFLSFELSPTLAPKPEAIAVKLDRCQAEWTLTGLAACTRRACTLMTGAAGGTLERISKRSSPEHGSNGTKFSADLGKAPRRRPERRATVLIA